MFFRLSIPDATNELDAANALHAPTTVSAAGFNVKHPTNPRLYGHGQLPQLANA